MFVAGTVGRGSGVAVVVGVEVDVELGVGVIVAVDVPVGVVVGEVVVEAVGVVVSGALVVVELGAAVWLGGCSWAPREAAPAVAGAATSSTSSSISLIFTKNGGVYQSVNWSDTQSSIAATVGATTWASSSDTGSPHPADIVTIATTIRMMSHVIGRFRATRRSISSGGGFAVHLR
jgi:hypothetical protein